jgi:heme O synthase-like polyprenyltransferase
MFGYSILYLTLLFTVLLVEHVLEPSLGRLI